MEARPDEPTVAQIVRALEKRVDDLEEMLNDTACCDDSQRVLWGRFCEAADHLDNIRTLIPPNVVKEQT